MIWWVAQNVVVTALLAGVVWIICKTTQIGPATRHALWLVVLIKLLTPPLVVWPWEVTDLLAKLDAKPAAEAETIVLTEPVESVEVDLSAIASPVSSADDVVIADLIEGPNEPIDVLIEPAEAEVSDVSLTYPADRSDETWTTWLSKASWPVWFAGAACFALLQAIRIVRMSARLRRGEAPHREVIEQVTSMSRRLRIKPVETRGVTGIGSPCIWAFFRPRLLWPAELSLKVFPNALRGIIVHELAHVKRRDHWVGWLELVAGCVWWWNPLFWYVRHQLRENAELACDAWVVSTLPAGRRAYAEALLAVCESVSRLSAPFPAVGASASGRQAIERRLNMILRGQSSFRLSRGGLLAALILAAMALPAWSQRSTSYETNVSSIPGAFGAVGESSKTALPADAQEIFNQYQQQEAEARREAERQAAERRQALIGKLQALQDRYAREGLLDEAVAVRDQIRALQPARTGTIKTVPDTHYPPAVLNLTQYRGRIGKSFQFEVVGDPQGTVWGSDIYTDDSSLTAAVVHAGVLQPGERGVVRVTILEGADSFEGSTRNGVTSSSYGSWPGSFHVESAAPGAAAAPNGPRIMPDPGTLYEFRKFVGQTLAFRVVGSTEGTVWGTDIYTDDSPLATAAVHAGTLQPGQSGVVRVVILPGQSSYRGSTRHGVTTQNYQSWGGSYLFLLAPASSASGFPPRVRMLGGAIDGLAAEHPGVPRYGIPGPGGAPPLDNQFLRVHHGLPAKQFLGLEGTAANCISCHAPGVQFKLDLEGSTTGAVWGTDVYTDDSSLETAAVHAGVLNDGERGAVRVTILEGQSEYKESTRNGITSQPGRDWRGSFRIDPVETEQD